MTNDDQISHDSGVSQQVQHDLQGIISQLEAAIAQRKADVNHALNHFYADGVSDDYQSVEHRWNRAANEVRQIIHLVRTTLLHDDETAANTVSQARSHVQSIC